jgi:hypothetical protein
MTKSGRKRAKSERCRGRSALDAEQLDDLAEASVSSVWENRP